MFLYIGRDHILHVFQLSVQAIIVDDELSPCVKQLISSFLYSILFRVTILTLSEHSNFPQVYLHITPLILPVMHPP